jgi:hypothetical protein
MVTMVAPADVAGVQAHLTAAGCASYDFGEVVAAQAGAAPVSLQGRLAWP